MTPQFWVPKRFREKQSGKGEAREPEWVGRGEEVVGEGIPHELAVEGTGREESKWWSRSHPSLEAPYCVVNMWVFWDAPGPDIFSRK